LRLPRITLIYVDSGGGHRAAAVALMEVIRQQQRQWDVQMVSIQDLLDPIDFIRKVTGVRFQDVYNIMLRRGWTAGTSQLIPLAHGLIRVTHDSQVKILEEYWQRNRPDVMVSLIPHYNRALAESLDRIWPRTPYVTLITDIADYPPHFWIEAVDQWVICGSPKAVEQARAAGIHDDRIFQTSGMILHPRFYEPSNLDRAAERKRRGLHPDLPTGLVLFGGEGSTEMVRIAKALNRAEIGIQLILLCGNNHAVAAELRELDRKIPMFVEGFTREIPMYMGLSDFFIGKPGPGSISEALTKKLPVIVQRNAWTMAHELYNTVWLEEIGAGIVVGNFSRDIAGAVQKLLLPENYARYRDRAGAVRNTAVYEIPEILVSVLEEVSEFASADALTSAKYSSTPVGTQMHNHPNTA